MKRISLISAIALFVFPVASLAQSYISYEEFGAVGDGIHDDQSAIIAAHNAANAKGLAVKAAEGRTYYIGKGKEIAVIKTDVDWSGAKFIIDDVSAENYRNPVFRVVSGSAPRHIEHLVPPRKGQKKLDAEFGQRSLVVLENSFRRIYIRMGLNQNNGHKQQESLIVDKDGNIESGSDLIWDYDNLSDVTVYPIDTTTLTIKGGEFTTIANRAEPEYKYWYRNIEVTRSNVVIENLRHYVTGEMEKGAPYHAFLFFKNCADVTVRNSIFTAHKIYWTTGSADKPVSMGTYDINAFGSVNIRFENCRQTTDINDVKYWGVYTSNYCKNLFLDNCTFSRFDVHQGVFNVTLKNSTFGHQGVRVIGSGTLLVENCVLTANYMLKIRDDYGSSWDGDVIFRDCRWEIADTGTDKAQMIHGYNEGKHDFGYPCCFPRHITVENLLIDDTKITNTNYSGPVIFSDFKYDPYGDHKSVYTIKGAIELINVKVKSGLPLRTSCNMEPFNKYKIIRTTNSSKSHPLRDLVTLRINHENGLYEKGEVVQVWADVTAVPEFDVYFNIMKGCSWKPSSTMKVTLKEGENLLFEEKIDTAVQYVFELTDGVKALYFKDPEAQGNVYAGVVVDPLNFRPGFDEPSDLLDFWHGEIAEMRKMEMSSEITKDRVENGFRTYHVDISCVGPKPVRAYVSYPIEAENKSLPIILYLHAAGSPGEPSRASYSLKYAGCVDGGALAMDLNAHGMLDDQPQSYYDELNRGELYRYSGREPVNRDDYYFKWMLLRAQRALDYLTSNPLWDGKHIIVSGTSQGGMQSAFLAGIDPRVTTAILTVPAGLDQGAKLQGRKSSWPDTIGKFPESTKLTSPYFDPALLLKYTKADIWCEIGMYDYTCPAANIFAALNTVTTPKTIITYQRPHSIQRGLVWLHSDVDNERWMHFRNSARK